MTMLASSSTLQAHAFSTSPLLPKIPRPLYSPLLRSSARTHPRLLALASADGENAHIEVAEQIEAGGETWKEEMVSVGEEEEKSNGSETFLYSVAPYPLLFAAALPGASTVRSIFGPFVELVKTWNLPDWLVHWGHPGNMAVVLFAMGGYGTYLGFRIRLSKDAEEKAMAKNLHPKLLGGMFFFFALGATGGITALLTSDRPILESPHAVTGLIGLSLLTVQTILPALFERAVFGKDPNATAIHDKMHRKIDALDAPDGGIPTPRTRGRPVDPEAELLGTQLHAYYDAAIAEGSDESTASVQATQQIFGRVSRLGYQALRGTRTGRRGTYTAQLEERVVSLSQESAAAKERIATLEASQRDMLASQQEMQQLLADLMASRQSGGGGGSGGGSSNVGGDNVGEE